MSGIEATNTRNESTTTFQTVKKWLKVGLKCKFPKGYIIHHLDSNRKNNSIFNLIALRTPDHVALHSILRVKLSKAQMKKYRSRFGIMKFRRKREIMRQKETVFEKQIRAFLEKEKQRKEVNP